MIHRDDLPAIGLGFTQIMGYGTLMYAYAILLPAMAADLGLSFGGLVTPFAFAWVTQAYGGWWSFAAMSLCLCAALATFICIPDPRRDQDDTAQDRRMPENS